MATQDIGTLIVNPRQQSFSGQLSHNSNLHFTLQEYTCSTVYKDIYFHCFFFQESRFFLKLAICLFLFLGNGSKHHSVIFKHD